RCGTDARLIQRGSDIDPSWLEGIGSVGITAGASAPEALVREVVDALGAWRTVDEDTLVTAEEKMIFKLPRQLVD
ncbi:MAG TPA: 4-hydroxy-3-methylbut-2-enyl diphosphate reductase, partial [Croceibacterium sp.]|nr:4-hydroxy-3-methylbut-2-enyl diphosphate reductase [Croceibacterium sp.]